MPAINVKVLEIGETSVKYKKWDNQDGPIYTINTENISFIKYQNGSKDIFDNYKSPKSDIAQSIDNAGNNVSNSVITSGKNIARGIDNSVYIQQQKLYSQARGLRVAGYTLSAICLGGFIALGVFTEPWVGAFGAIIGVPTLSLCLISANRKEATADCLVLSDIYRYDINDNFSVGLMASKNNFSHTYSMGPSFSVRF